MRVAVLYGPLCLSFRKSFDFATLREDPRGLSGSEMGFVRIAEELQTMGHEVDVCPHGAEPSDWNGKRVMPKPEGRYDCAIAINEPDLLRDVDAKVRACPFWLNDVSFCKAGFWDHVDLFASPSQPHLDQVMGNPAWHRVEVTPEHPNGRVTFVPDPSKWCVVPLGTDPERYEGVEKVPGRVVYCSSPDRGLHWLLQEWPRIKQAVPHAHLSIFYRLQKWIDDLKSAQQPDGSVFHSVRALFDRAMYIEEALRRMSDPKWGIEVRDSVSRATIEREMAEAEVLAYPCDTTTWSEGFSCTVLEACAARACPVIWDTDALGSIYGDAAAVVWRGDLELWRAAVIDALQQRETRETVNERAHRFAQEHTWKATASKLMASIQERM